MTKRYSHDGVTIIDHLKKDLIYINGKDELLELAEYVDRLQEENERLRKQKARYKRLSEIRNEEINNRILTIKEFIDNCSNEKVKKALEDLFYSEVNEYDLSKKYRKLYDKNKELKYKLRNCKDARKSYKQDWKACVSYCDEYKNKIISLKDEIKQLKQHNTELIKKIDMLERIIDGDV